VVLLATVGGASHFGENHIQKKEEAARAKAHDQLLSEIRSGVFSLQPNPGLRLRYILDLPLDDPALVAYRNRLAAEIAAHSNALTAGKRWTNSIPILSRDIKTGFTNVVGLRFDGRSSLRPGGSPVDGKHAKDVVDGLGLYGSFSEGLASISDSGNYPPDANVKIFGAVREGEIAFEFGMEPAKLNISVTDIKFAGPRFWKSDGKVGSLIGLQRCLFFCRLEWNDFFHVSDVDDFFDDTGGRISTALQLSAVGFDVAGVQLDCHQLKPVTNHTDRAFYQPLSNTVRSVRF
jgi:hypothetical protein